MIIWIWKVNAKHFWKKKKNYSYLGYLEISILNKQFFQDCFTVITFNMDHIILKCIVWNILFLIALYYIWIASDFYMFSITVKPLIAAGYLLTLYFPEKNIYDYVF